MMGPLSAEQIADYLNPLAFARERTTRVGLSEIGVATGAIRSADIESSYRLVSGASSRLETLEGNLTTMLKLAREGAAASNLRGREEAYGKLRSLGAGFDQVVEAIRFDGRSVFTGDSLVLDLGQGARSLELDPVKLLTYGDDSLNLSRSRPSAVVNVDYRLEDAISNQAYDIIGLDIDDAGYLSPADPIKELESGIYKLNITYKGADSSIELRDSEGALVEIRDQVDLSGDGREWVDFESGFRLSFEKLNLFTTFDKFDFENRGPAKLTATLDYRRIDEYILRTGEDPQADSLSMPFEAKMSIGGSQSEILNPHMAPVSTDVQPADDGRYLLEVDYAGEHSRVRLKDSLGRLERYLFDVDLSAEGSTTVDLGNGMSFDWKNSGALERQNHKLTAVLDYKLANPPVDDFDFEAYAEELEEAIEVVQQQRQIFADAKLQIENTYSTQNTGGATVTSYANSGAVANVTSLLSGSVLDGSLFGGLTSANLKAISEQIFGATFAFSVQGGINESVLGQLENQALSGTWFADY